MTTIEMDRFTQRIPIIDFFTSVLWHTQQSGYIRTSFLLVSLLYVLLNNEIPVRRYMYLNVKSLQVDHY